VEVVPLNPIIIIGPVLTAIAVAAFLYFKRMTDRPGGPIVVVDERSARLALARIAAAATDNDFTRATAGVTSLRIWLRQAAADNPRRYRAFYDEIQPHLDEILSLVILGEALNRPQEGNSDGH